MKFVSTPEFKWRELSNCLYFIQWMNISRRFEGSFLNFKGKIYFSIIFIIFKRISVELQAARAFV